MGSHRVTHDWSDLAAAAATAAAVCWQIILFLSYFICFVMNDERCVWGRLDLDSFLGSICLSRYLNYVRYFSFLCKHLAIISMKWKHWQWAVYIYCRKCLGYNTWRFVCYCSVSMYPFFFFVIYWYYPNTWTIRWCRHSISTHDTL